MALKFTIILQNLITAYHRKIGEIKYDRKLAEIDRDLNAAILGSAHEKNDV